jgi:hypothetical protein
MERASEKIIGASLGHKSNEATKNYASITVDPIRRSPEHAVAAMEKAKPSKGVFKIGKK